MWTNIMEFSAQPNTYFNRNLLNKLLVLTSRQTYTILCARDNFVHFA
jgi:hypothetical protein